MSNVESPEKKKTGLELLREPFPENLVSKLPKGTKAQNQCKYEEKVKCDICGGFHHPKVIHLDYVGHAALTDRLLDADPNWNWEPYATTEDGLPAFDNSGGLWIRLTVCGQTRIGYGHAEKSDYKEIGSREKEVIGDCLVSGTKIITKQGIKLIEDIKQGDLVPTRDGWRFVSDHWLSHKKAPLVTVLFSNGSILTGTPHHTIPTINGKKPLTALRNGDKVFTCHIKEKVSQHKISNGKGVSIEETQRTGLCTGKNILCQPLAQGIIFIEMFMKNIMAKYLPDTISTIKTKITTTIAQKTLSLLAHQTIPKHTACYECGLSRNVTNAGKSIQLFSKEQGGAAPRVKRCEDAKKALLMYGLKLRRKASTLYAKNVAPCSNQQKSGLSFAVTGVEGIIDAGEGEVWNISVDGNHEYVANNIIVCNSLRNAAMRFGAALDLWHKGVLHPAPPPNYKEEANVLIKMLQATKTIPHKDNWKSKHADEINSLDAENKTRVVAAGQSHAKKLTDEFKAKKAEEKQEALLAPEPCPERPGETKTLAFCNEICTHRKGCPVFEKQ